MVGDAVSLEEGESWAKCEVLFDGAFSFSQISFSPFYFDTTTEKI